MVSMVNALATCSLSQPGKGGVEAMDINRADASR